MVNDEVLNCHLLSFTLILDSLVEYSNVFANQSVSYIFQICWRTKYEI